MDTPQTITCIEWCFGYGGNHLGLKRVIRGLRCIAASEIEAYAIANLVAKMEVGLLEPFPIWTDLKNFPCELFRDLVDIFIASYPCQPFSSSGKRKGADDPRHLWPFVRRAIEIIRPRYVFLENVEGHVSLGLREVLTELALLGYRVENSRGEPTWGIFSAAETGAPQNRKRVFILAKREGVAQGDTLRQQTERFYPRGFFDITAGTGAELAESKFERQSSSRKAHKRTAGSTRTVGSGLDVGDSEGERDGAVSTRPRDERFGATKPDGAGQGVGQADSAKSGFERRRIQGLSSECRPLFWPEFIARPGEQQRDWEPPRVIETKRGLGGGVNGRASNVDRLRLLGNGVYPATALKAWCELIRRHD